MERKAESKVTPRKQCAKCPWKKSVNPFDIPNGYDVDKHKALKGTCRGGHGASLKIMACHESPVGNEKPCVGWLVNQLGPGNNIGLRVAVIQKRISANVELDGPQHATFEATLPRGLR